jgi:hypothetical protein
VDRLWRRAERRKRIDDGPFADRRYARDVNLPDKTHAVFQLDVGTDYTIRADFDAVPNAGTVGDARCYINRHVLTDPSAACCLRLPTLCVERKTQRDVVTLLNSCKRTA